MEQTELIINLASCPGILGFIALVALIIRGFVKGLLNHEQMPGYGESGLPLDW